MIFKVYLFDMALNGADKCSIPVAKALCSILITDSEALEDGTYLGDWSE